jgi:hypothetical protein
MTRNQEHAVRSIIALLADRQYDAVASMTGSRRLTSAELRAAVEEYGRTIVIPLGGLPPGIDEIQDGEDPQVLYLVVDMWTAEEGRSDLSLELTLTANRLGLVDVEIDNLHMM